MNFKFLLNTILIVSIFACQSDNNSAIKNKEDNDLYLLKDQVKANHLYSVSDVKEILDQNKNIIIFEVSKIEEYNKGHIPGAYHLWRTDFTSTKDNPISGLMASKQEMESLLSGFGVKPESKLLIYDNNGNVEALRLLWILQIYGHEDIMIINGSKKAWELADFPIELKRNLPVQKSQYQFVNETDLSSLTSFEEVQESIGDTNTIILDAREPYEYLGQAYLKNGHIHEFKPDAFINGRIINAKHLNWSSTVDLDRDHRFKSYSELEYDFQKAGLNKDKKIIVYCHSGVRSSHTTYVLKEILGYPHVKNYDGSWIEWSYNHVNFGNVEIEKISDEKNKVFIDSLKNILNKADE